MEYDKLVRDKIPNIIRNAGKVPVTHIASPHEFEIRLVDKLKEEGDEFEDAGKEERAEELADILQVWHEMCDIAGFTPTQIEKLRKRKLRIRGGFTQRIILEKVENDD